MATEAEHLACAQEHCVAAAKLITDAAAASVSDHSLPPEGRIAMIMLAQILAGSFDDGLLAVFERMKTIEGLAEHRESAATAISDAAEVLPQDDEARDFYYFLADVVEGQFDDAICRTIRGGKDPEP